MQSNHFSVIGNEKKILNRRGEVNLTFGKRLDVQWEYAVAAIKWREKFL